ncbi:membrane magnesium transporter-domain-containing protein [Syncephalis pseudoplumigaleata]|uniref:Membrane magnesium transporter-domain-containing protein n=1 Tax=Syncephalis pseudoplumigaleata TaxID=1712513 RepID=A0A4P9YYR0_9FUNG|nr:membrane magnesium transporter-domain-containing protein [Syncephalis pseudoplumigaleata]RKP24150.1 membrane magnesium transporter-domain-containing protein [Syncephalis pseudoplumigaleata]|eukprot:RKP23550.1 membrane magnesium transporter-domain-containing protein [Syncephalis pseudoplumigaleata]
MTTAKTAPSTPASPSYLGYLLCSVGMVLLTHAGYSTYEHLSYLKAVARSADGLSFDIIVECLAGMLVLMIGVTLVSGPLREALLEEAMATQTVEEVESRPSFVTFHGRSRVLFAP